MLQRFADDRRAQRVFIAYGRLVHALRDICSQAKHYHQTLRNAKERIVDTVQQCTGSLGVDRAIRVFGISRSTYQDWLQRVKAKCDRSTLLLCRRRYPYQLLAKEIQCMKRLLMDPTLSHWPVRSIALYAARTRLIHASRNTWYRYRRLLGITRPVLSRAERKPGIRACTPDQIWHADVTLFRTLDGMRHFIYLVVDNFSRRVLAWRVATVLSGMIRVQTLQEAWKAAVVLRGGKLRTDLIVDGGPENMNHVVDTFVASAEVNIHRKIALKEVLFSNSMVEATNKILKYRYLLPKEAANTAALIKAVDWFVHDMNAVRPHGDLDGLTPDEAYLGLKPDIPDLDEQRRIAREHRLELNTTTSCGKCL